MHRSMYIYTHDYIMYICDIMHTKLYNTELVNKQIQ